MASVQERLQIKREPLDKWSIREQFCLASAVATRIGDQNWMSVSRALKPFGDPSRPADWFHQKNCAAQYWALLENVETPKRKKRTSAPDAGVETPAESILKKLKVERLAETKKLLAEEKAEYARLQEDMLLLNSGNVSDDQLDKWCKEIDEEEQLKEEEAIAHAKWLKEREIRKQEIERAWRPTIKINVTAPGQKRKLSESADSIIESDAMDETPTVTPTNTPEPGKSAQSPLLTSLLKSPSHPQSVVTSSILHTAITSQRPTTTNPTIASLLNSSSNVSVSPTLQHLVTTAIGQDPANADVKQEIAEDDSSNILPTLKVEDIETIESTILAAGEALPETLPEIKDEEVEVIISDLIENAEIVTDPEEHLQLDDNVDLMENLENELQELVKAEEENAAKTAAAAALMKSINKAEIAEKEPVVEVDPFEFQEEEVYEQPQSSTYKPMQQDKEFVEVKVDEIVEELEIKQMPRQEAKEVEEPKKGSVEIVEVVVMEDEEIDKELNKAQIEDIVHSTKPREPLIMIETQPLSVEQSSEENKTEKDSCEESNTESIDIELKSDVEVNKDSISPETIETTETETTDSTKPVLTPEFTDDIFDVNMELKVDKPGKAKRDYSRNKKKEEKDLDLLFAVEQSQLEEEQETCSEKEFSEFENKKDIKKIKQDSERSNSPWTEEDDVSLKSRRRYSTPATPVDSIPNSPGSTTTNEDEKEYKNWKKSVLLMYNRLITHKYSSLFLKPITDDQAPGYHNVVFRPMDLQTIRRNIENGTIRTTAEFKRDVLLMFNNATMYNKTNDHVYNMACEMQQEGIQQMQLFVQAQQTDAPARRETRTGEREPIGKRKRISEEPTSRKRRKED